MGCRMFQGICNLIINRSACFNSFKCFDLLREKIDARFGNVSVGWKHESRIVLYIGHAHPHHGEIIHIHTHWDTSIKKIWVIISHQKLGDLQ